MELFHYSTLNVSLKKESHSLIIQFKSTNENKINFEQLFELESVLAWASNKLEINSILFTADNASFCEGIEIQNTENNPEKLERLLQRVRKIGESLCALPQTTIADLKLSAAGVGAELALYCDLRVAQEGATINLNHLTYGLTPSCGGLYQLVSLVGLANAKSWVLSGKKVEYQALLSSGLISQSYHEHNSTQVIDSLLLAIEKQSSISRIQSKMAFFQLQQEHNEKGIKIENQINKANLLSNDWTEAIQAIKVNKQPEYMKAKSFSYTIAKAKNEIEELLKP